MNDCRKTRFLAFSLTIALTTAFAGQVFCQPVTFDSEWLPDFSRAEKWAGQSGQDVVVVIGAEWCAPCHVLKNNLVDYAKSSKTESVQLACLDFDSDETFAKSIMQGTTVPQLIYLRRINEEWKPIAVLPRVASAGEIRDMIEWTRLQLRRSSANSKASTTDNSRTAGPMLPPDPASGKQGE